MGLLYKIKFTIFGFLLGCIFPIIGYIKVNNLSFTDNHLMHLISFAPIVLAIAGYLIGEREDKLIQNIGELNKRVLELSVELAKEEKVKAIESMVTTFNHEIRNPLTIAMLSIGDDLLLTTDQHDRIKISHKRILEILNQISKLRADQVKYIKYCEVTNMIELSKRN